ncbi:MAG: thiol peroxidase [Elusimicrobiales bacterium]|nr:thiol peroxidase [Elusimicrobiales bacterium]HOJ86371.1 thiol peroxidase [Elusimicrobiales bacterium]HOL63271.1 thiol peroxidase [Elusimicrobiales bacterium]HPO95196.1 thiol peroxidase [Elusimicrobiales bacterium]
MEENINNEVKRTVTLQGREMTLIGDEIKIGDKAPDFKVTSNDMTPMKFLRTYKGKVVLISSVPSLDTPVCDLETRRFNDEALKLSSDVEIITISMDLPFAQKRWCGQNGVTRVKTYSDYMKAEFGKSYGVLIKELRLLARCIFIIDKEGVVRYVQLVKEVSKEPNYEEAITALKQLLV